jgi:hypothetical protein
MKKSHQLKLGLPPHGPPRPPREPDPDLPSLSLEEIRAFIEVSTWTFAKTMPHTPHEYTLRRNARAAGLEPIFDRFVMHIRRHGYKHKYGTATYIYLDVDAWHYWTMGCPLYIPPPFEHQGTILINRAKRSPQHDRNRKA